MTPEELAAIRARDALLRSHQNGTTLTVMTREVYEAQWRAPDDRAALLAEVDRLTEESHRNREGWAGAMDICREFAAAIETLTPHWHDGEPPIDEWLLMDFDGGARPVYSQVDADGVIRYSAAGRWRIAERARLQSWGTARWAPIVRPS